MVTLARIVLVPAVAELIVKVQLPVVPTVVHEPFAGVAVAPLLVTAKLIMVPTGALAFPLPSFTFT